MSKSWCRTNSETQRTFWHARQKFATIPICLFMETTLGATAFMAWKNDNWVGMVIVTTAALILTGFPYGMFWVTDVGEPRRPQGDKTCREKRQDDLNSQKTRKTDTTKSADSARTGHRRVLMRTSSGSGTTDRKPPDAENQRMPS